MTAIGVKTSVSKQELAQAGISPADLVWIKSCRNSAVRQTPRFQQTYQKVQSFLQGRAAATAGMPA